MSKRKVTDVELIDAIRQTIADQGYPPSIRDLAEMVGLSGPTVHGRLVRLEQSGVIRRIMRNGVTVGIEIEGNTDGI